MPTSKPTRELVRLVGYATEKEKKQIENAIKARESMSSFLIEAALKEAKKRGVSGVVDDS